MAAVTALLCACNDNDPSDPGKKESHSDPGMYVGITSFSDNVKYYGSQDNRYHSLTKSNSTNFTSFVNGLSMGDATVLYYAVDNNLSYLEKCQFPADLSSVNIITFTDGLNQGSRALDKKDGNHKYAEDDKSYVTEINRKIKSIKVGGQPINAYAIGIRGKDVQGDAAKTFSDNLVQLSSSKDNAMEVANMDEVSARFKEIAESLYKKSESRTLRITIPMPSENEKERFTFDDVTEATASKCYLEGVYAGEALTDIKYVGCMSTSGAKVQETSAGGVKIQFEFENFTDDKGNAISFSKMQQWHMKGGETTWTRNSEFKPSEAIVTTEEHKTAVVMLILDCSSSLGSDFAKVKSAASDFIKTLAGEITSGGGNSGGNTNPEDNTPYCWEITYMYQGYSQTAYIWATEAEVKASVKESEQDPDISNYSYKRASANDEHSCEALNNVDPTPEKAQVRFYKVDSDERIIALGIANEDYSEVLAYHEFGTDAGVSPYYEIPTGTLIPIAYWLDDGNDPEGWYKWNSLSSYNFEAGKKYTYSVGDEITITLDGTFNAPAKSQIVAQGRIIKSKLSKLPKIRK